MTQSNPLSAKIAKELIEWIKGQEFYQDQQQTNYAVGLTTNGNIIISKVGGVTEKTKGMADLQSEIEQTQWYSDYTPNVYLAQKYGSGDGNNNHGEMCVLAAADALKEDLYYILCTGDNCPACFAMLEAAGVLTGNVQATGKQLGWVHPRGRLALGTGLGAKWENQIAELKQYNKLSEKQQEKFEHMYTQPGSFTPQGSCTRLL